MHDGRCSKTGKHAPLQAGGGLKFSGRGNYSSTGARAGRVAGGDG